MLLNNNLAETNPLILNTKEITTSLKKSGEYKNDQIIIKPWSSTTESGDSLMFVIQNLSPSEEFLGIVNFIFQREGYCLNCYSNKDKYFGYYLDDKRNKQGLYEFHPTKIKSNNNKDFIIKEYYFGLWKDDLIHGKGINLWLKLEENEKEFTNFTSTNFQAFVGNSIEGVFNKGVILSKERDNYFIYYGTFLYDRVNDKNILKKNGDNCFYFCAKLEMLYFGTFQGGEFSYGYVCKYNDEGEIKSLMKFNKNEEKDKKFLDEEKLELNEVNEKKKIMTDFRNVIMSQDYFGILYEEMEKIIKFRDNNMKNIDTLISDEYVSVMKSFSSFNKITICKDIENYIKI